jgi:hypothetical protein
MEWKYTRHQTARGTRADAEKFGKIYLIKNVSMLRATYQIKLLAFKAVQTHKKLVLDVPKTCQFHESLKNLIKQNREIIKRENL